MKVKGCTHTNWGYWALITEPAMLPEAPQQREGSSMRQTTLCAQIPVIKQIPRIPRQPSKRVFQESKNFENQGTGIIEHQDVNLVKY